MANTQNILEKIDEMVVRWGDILVPIYTEKENYDSVVQLLGTGFFVAFNSRAFLVTALHTIADHTNKPLYCGIGSKMVPIIKMPFNVSEEDDLAISILSQDWALKHDIKKIKALPLDDFKTNYQSLDTYFLIGFPGGKNTINPRIGKTKKHIRGISFGRRIESPNSKTHFKNPVAFEFNKNDIITTQGKKMKALKFSGSSGGPILELLQRPLNGIELTTGCKLAGVFVGWHKEEKEAVAIRFETLLKFIVEMDT